MSLLVAASLAHSLTHSLALTLSLFIIVDVFAQEIMVLNMVCSAQAIAKASCEVAFWQWNV